MSRKQNTSMYVLKQNEMIRWRVIFGNRTKERSEICGKCGVEL